MGFFIIQLKIQCGTVLTICFNLSQSYLKLTKVTSSANMNNLTCINDASIKLTKIKKQQKP